MTKQSNIFLAASLTLSLSVLGCGGGSKAPAQAPSNEAPTATEPVADANPSAESILDRYVEVTGGADAYKATTTITMNSTVSIEGTPISGPAVTYIEGNKYRSTITLTSIGVVDEGFDGETMWTMDPQTGARIITGVEKAQKLRTQDPLGAVNWRDHYKSYTVTGKEDINGSSAYVVELVDVDDIPGTKYFDVESGLHVREKMISKSQAGDSPMVLSYSDYADIGGVKMPKTTSINTGPMTIKVIASEAKMNEALPADAFTPPADIVALRDAQKAK